MTVREFKKLIEEASNGDVFYINSIDLSDRSIAMLRKLIKTGVLVPVRREVETMYKEPDAVMSGEVILPELHYEIRKD